MSPPAPIRTAVLASALAWLAAAPITACGDGEPPPVSETPCPPPQLGDPGSTRCHCPDPGDDACVVGLCEALACDDANAHCRAHAGLPTCTCDDGFVSGDAGICIDDPCSPDPCGGLPHTFCQPVGTKSVCACAIGFHDDGTGGCTDDPCLPDPCTEPASHCEVAGATTVCICDPGHHDDGLGHCTDDPCVPDPCEAPYVCRGEPGEQARCACPDGTHADGAGGCTTDPCLPDPCRGDHEVCVQVSADAAECQCAPGWHDDGAGGCSDDPCVPDPCPSPLDACVLVDGVPTCACLPAYDDDGAGGCVDDPCRPDPCTGQNRHCEVAAGQARCACDPGTILVSGACIDDPCEPDPCAGALEHCERVGTAAVCRCDPGSHADGAGGCTTDPCTPDPCADPAAECVVVGGSATCPCRPGYLVGSDDRCVDDPCSPFPCEASHLCSVGGHDEAVCTCPAGWHEDGAGGCTTDPCLPDPCRAAGRLCVETSGGSYRCDCPEGLHEDGAGGCTSDPCLPDPCAGAPYHWCVVVNDEGRCIGCIDGDGDGYGWGQGCLGYDCDDTTAAIADAGCDCPVVPHDGADAFEVNDCPYLATPVRGNDHVDLRLATGDVDWFVFAVRGGRSFVFEQTWGDIGRAELFGGHPIYPMREGYVGRSMHGRAELDWIYFVRVTGPYALPNAGGFTVRFTDADDVSHWPALAGTIAADGVWRNAVLQVSALGEVDCWVHFLDPLRHFRFEVESVGGFQVALADRFTESVASVPFDPRHNEYPTDSDALARAFTPVRHCAEGDAPFGLLGDYPYRVRLVDLGRDEHGDIATAATPIAPDGVSHEGRTDTPGDNDFFVADLQAGDVYQITVDGALFNMLGPGDDILPIDIAPSSVPHTRRFTVTTSGPHYIRLSQAWRADARYTFALARLDGPDADGNVTKDDARPLLVGVWAQAGHETLADVDWFELEAAPGVIYGVELEAAAGGPFNVDGDPSLGTCPFPPVSAQSPRCRFELEAGGRQRLRVKSPELAAPPQDYRLRVTVLGQDEGDTPANATTLTVDVPWVGTFFGELDADVFEVALDPAATYELRIEEDNVRVGLALDGGEEEPVAPASPWYFNEKSVARIHGAARATIAVRRTHTGPDAYTVAVRELEVATVGGEALAVAPPDLVRTIAGRITDVEGLHGYRVTAPPGHILSLSTAGLGPTWRDVVDADGHVVVPHDPIASRSVHLGPADAMTTWTVRVGKRPDGVPAFYGVAVHDIDALPNDAHANSAAAATVVGTSQTVWGAFQRATDVDWLAFEPPAARWRATVGSYSAAPFGVALYDDVGGSPFEVANVTQWRSPSLLVEGGPELVLVELWPRTSTLGSWRLDVAPVAAATAWPVALDGVAALTTIPAGAAVAVPLPASRDVLTVDLDPTQPVRVFWEAAGTGLGRRTWDTAALATTLVGTGEGDQVLRIEAPFGAATVALAMSVLAADDHPDTPDTAAELAAGAAATSGILHGPDDDDVFVFEAEPGWVYQVVASSARPLTCEIPSLDGRRTDGTTYAGSAECVVVVAPDASGRRAVRIASATADPMGTPFTIRLVAFDRAGSDMATAETIVPGEPLGRAHEWPGQVRWYRLHVPGEAVVKATADGLGTTGTLYAFELVAGVPVEARRVDQFIVCPRTTDLVFAVAPSGTQRPAYTLTTEVVSRPEDALGEIPTAYTLGAAGAVWFPFEVESDVMRILAVEPSAPGVLYVLHDDGVTRRDPSSGWGRSFDGPVDLASVTLAPGRYWVGVQGGGDVSLRVFEPGPGHGLTRDSPIPLVVDGAPWSGTPRTLFVYTYWFSFEAQAGRDYLVDAASPTNRYPDSTRLQWYEGDAEQPVAFGTPGPDLQWRFGRSRAVGPQVLGIELPFGGPATVGVRTGTHDAHGDDPSSATWMQADGSVQHDWFDVHDDEDWFALHLEAGGYAIEGDMATYVEIALFHDDGTAVVQIDVGRVTLEEMRWLTGPLPEGDYFVRVMRPQRSLPGGADSMGVLWPPGWFWWRMRPVPDDWPYVPATSSWDW